VAIREPWPLRILGYARLELDTAAAPRLGDDGRPVPTETTIPMVARERVCDLAGEILPGGDRALATPLTRAAPVATVRYALETALRALPRAALACWFLHSAHGAWLLLWALLTGAVGGSMLRWGRTETHLVTRTGWWTRTTWIVPRARVQQVTVLRDPVQRALGTATVRVAYAGGAVAVRDARVDDARALVAWLEGAGVSPTGPDGPIGP
jgi:putative membrane protein